MNESETSVSSSPAGGILRSSSFEHMEHPEDPLDTPPLPKGSPGFQYQQGPRSFSAHGMNTKIFQVAPKANHRQVLITQTSTISMLNSKLPNQII